MAKLQNTPPAYWPPTQEAKGYSTQIGPYGPTISRRTRHRAPGPSSLFQPYWQTYGVNIVTWRRKLHASISKFWRTDLTNAERALWAARAAIMTLTNYKGETNVPSGYHLFMFYATHDYLHIPWYPPWNTTPPHTPRKTPPIPWLRPTRPTLITVDTSIPGEVWIETSDDLDYDHTGCFMHVRPAPNSMPTVRPGQYIDCDSWITPDMHHPWFSFYWPTSPALLPRGKSWTIGLRYVRLDDSNTSDPSWISFTDPG
jgi:hypothetical protein